MPLRIDNESELREAQAALFNINSVSGWLLLNYVGPSTVHFAAGGEGGPEEVSYQLEEDQIQYALVRISVPGGGRATVRDVFVTSIGPGVGIIEKGKKTILHEDARSLLQPFHTDITVLNKRNFNTDT